MEYPICLVRPKVPVSIARRITGAFGLDSLCQGDRDMVDHLSRMWRSCPLSRIEPRAGRAKSRTGQDLLRSAGLLVILLSLKEVERILSARRGR
jgi:hypothetical protein